MGFFDFFKKKNKQQATTSSISDNRSAEYFQLMSEAPHFVDYIGRSLSDPKFDDTFQSNTGFKLRELLLLVWWGNTKNGRKKDVTIPKYFYSNYNLKASSLTKRFFKEGLLEVKDDRIHLTEKGKVIHGQYKKLWEIHTVKNFPINLDTMFSNWDKDGFYIRYYQILIKYSQDEIVHSTKMINYIRNSNNFINAESEEEYYMKNREDHQNDIADYESKIEALRQ